MLSKKTAFLHICFLEYDYTIIIFDNTLKYSDVFCKINEAIVMSGRSAALCCYILREWLIIESGLYSKYLSIYLPAEVESCALENRLFVG